MNYLDKQLYLYFINNEDDSFYNELVKLFKEHNENINEHKQKVKKSVKKMRKELKNYNIYSLSKDNFNNILSILEEYKLTEEETTKVEKIINKLSEIHDIEIPEEKNELTEEEIFYKFCTYYINDNESIDTYNELLSISKKYDFLFNEMQAEAINFVENLKVLLEKINLTLSFDSFNELLRKYKSEKKHYSDAKKEEYLKILATLARIYNINLRDELIKNIEEQLEETNLNFNNPLDNDEFLKKLLQSRYDNGIFKVQELDLTNDIKPNDSNTYDNTKDQANLTLRLINIFYDKLSNYANDDLNEFFLSLVSEDDLNRIGKLTEKDIYTYVMAIKKHIDKDSICEKLNITNSIYNFIYMIQDTTNIYDDFIGIGNKNIFKTEEYVPAYTIYLNTPNSKYTHEFLSEYVIKCIDNNLDYYMTGLNINGNNKDRTIIYASKTDLDKKLSIINTLIKEYSECSDKFGTPIHYVKPNTESLYSISNYISEEITFNDYFNDICEVGYYRVLAKLLTNKIDNETELNIINSIIKLDNINTKELPSTTIYNAYTFDEIKDTINRNIPDIINTIRLYIEEETNIENFINEFKKSITYIYNIHNELDKKNETNIFFNEQI